MKLELDKRFRDRLAARYGRFELRAGILRDGPHYAPLPRSKGLTSFEGRPARKKSRKRESTLQAVGRRIRRVHRVDYLRAPFESRQSKEIRALMRELGRLLTQKSKSIRSVSEALRRVIREPIRRKRYGTNSPFTQRMKGFNHRLWDTAQFYRAIVAKVTSKRSRRV